MTSAFTFLACVRGVGCIPAGRVPRWGFTVPCGCADCRAMYVCRLWFHTGCMKKTGDGANPLCEGCLRAAKEAGAEPRAKRGRAM